MPAPPGGSPPKRTRKVAVPKPKTPRAPRATGGWGAWLFWEAATLCVGAGIGLGITTWVLWERANRDVAAWLAAPPPTRPGVIWSAPITVAVGQRASLAGLAGDLLAAGYDRVDRLPDPPPATGVGAFAVQADRIEVWTTGWDGPGDLSVPAGRATVRLDQGWVVETVPRGPIRLHPTALATIGDAEARRSPIRLQDLSPWVEPALLAMEDARFRQHHGVDPVGLGRALIHNLLTDGGAQGGSTLTQQLAKNVFLTRERRVQRKVREVFFAAALEHQLTKDALLEAYLNEVYLGQFGGLPLHGVEQAARAWFGVGADRLTLDQAATLAGVISAPSVYSPVRDPEAARVRRDRVLRRMVQVSAISEAEAEAASAAPVVLSGTLPGAVRRAPYAVDATVAAAEVVLGDGALAREGWQVYTHVQPLLQRAAEEAVAAGAAELDAEHPEAAGAQVALVALDPRTGGVLALVGGRDYATSMYNRAVAAHRQAGSTVKPLTLLAAMQAGKATPSTALEDAPITRRVKGTTWTPRNYDGVFLGQVTARQAIEGSRNIPAIHLAERVGYAELERYFERAGLDEATSWPSMALGSFDVTPLALAGAYTVFPTGGVARAPQLVDRIASADGKTTREVDAPSQRLADARAAAAAVHVLEGVLTSGTGARAATYGVRGAAGGKSGTTDNYRDAWFVGFTPTLVVAVWVGRDEGALGLSGSKAALPTWARFVAASGTLDGRFRRPDGVDEIPVCAASGQPPRPDCPEVIDEWFVGGSAPAEPCPIHAAAAPPAPTVLDAALRREEPAPDLPPPPQDPPPAPAPAEGPRRRAR
jgi:penicillin-binding protein 1B